MKIFEVIEFVDGGPNDRGSVIGYVKAESEEKASEKAVKDSFQGVRELTWSAYHKRIEQALATLEKLKHPIE